MPRPHPVMSPKGAYKVSAQRPGWIRVLVGLVLLTSLAANAWLLGQTREGFAKLQFVRVFPLGFVQPGGGPVLSTQTRVTIVVRGDSRAADWAAQLSKRRNDVLNLAHGAQTSTQALLQLRNEPPLATQVTLLQIGINDLHPLGTMPRLRERVTQQLHGNLRAMRDELLARSRTVVLSTIVLPGPVPWDRQFDWDPATLDEVRAANRTLRALADGDRVLLLDAAALLADPRGLLDPRHVSTDFFLHLNDGAYALLNAELDRMLAVTDAPRK